jgi:hypothetical protein
LALAVPRQAVRDLGANAGAFPDPFSAIAGVYELRDGRVLVADSREKSLNLYGASLATSTAVARVGDGPGEFRTPGRLFAWAGDSVAMYDASVTRVMIIAPSGIAVRSYQLDQTLSYAAAKASRGDIRFLDPVGRAFAQSTAIPIAAPGTVAPDSGPVLRYDPAGQRVDTVAMVKLSNLAQRQSADGFALNIGALANPFRTYDAWIGFADGRVAVVRSKPYSVEWIAPNGNRVTGPPVAVTPVPVTARDRDRIHREGVSVGGRALPVPLDLLNDLPSTKPAFDARAIVADPAGAVWVQRFGRADDTTVMYDVFDERGRLVTRVRVPADDRIVHISERYVYVARTDADGLHWLRRHLK